MIQCVDVHDYVYDMDTLEMSNVLLCPASLVKLLVHQLQTVLLGLSVLNDSAFFLRSTHSTAVQKKLQSSILGHDVYCVLGRKSRRSF